MSREALVTEALEQLCENKHTTIRVGSEWVIIRTATMTSPHFDEDVVAASDLLMILMADEVRP